MGLFSADNPRDTAVAWMFVIVQFVLLIAIVILPAGDAWANPTWLVHTATLLQWLGVAVLVVGLVNLGRSLTPLPSPVPHGELRTGGLYRLMRHPIYSGIMALTIGLAVRSTSVAVAAVTVGLVGWFMAKARWEEHRLLDRYPGYGDYARHTPRFTPGWPWGADRA
jgi:protein-S-isoprenylcysteine O-methyltransferase Ste14